ncbi:hypothetical protein ACFXJ8_30500 [Nonomuraea sp. NPDC059194]|uniref:hypothetical protein n=1 Tax=Nonomuraea sp. NPDC059194 TaxID=3346764 RepID=UPI00369E58A9
MHDHTTSDLGVHACVTDGMTMGRWRFTSIAHREPLRPANQINDRHFVALARQLKENCADICGLDR